MLYINKIKASKIVNFVKNFLGLCIYYRKFIKNFLFIEKFLHYLIKKK